MNNYKIVLVPDLRFPEFKDCLGWENDTVGNTYDFKVTNSFSRENLNYEKGLVKNIHYGDIHTKFNTLLDISKEKELPYINLNTSIDKIKAENYCVEGDVIFADASEDINDIGKSIEIVNLNEQKVLSGLHTLLARKKNGKFISGFGGYLFKSNHVREQIQREAQGAKVLGISASRISNVNIYYPKCPEEQQKIVSCLSSLDEVIEAQAQKLEALKEYKKGLMQNLFPQEGESVPRMRFPEFLKDGGWEELLLGDAAKFSSGGTPSKDIAEYWNGDIPWISASSMHDLVAEKSELYLTDIAIRDGASISRKGNILILVRGSMLFKRIPICITGRDVSYNQDVKSLELKKEIDNVFFLYLLISNESKLLESVTSTGIGAGKLETDGLKKLALRVPSNKDEQLAVASCLTNLEVSITSQTEKIEQLILHKKGLMQSLFPKIIKN
ncbi:restriction endonuclease subunit S [Dyadobacter sp. CY323]|uniref:restriction endonuclease subunit S n=1 Tax=Dyadobacter sp. CY323 TaxID=2907302 RepID=UPI001F17AF87|nr:restriction endonuclease subunit S [Dyadobacter sp. CY323]MCE6989876.1 restriction endonuclease subunit S [Dyadobacter sp. CY323]